MRAYPHRRSVMGSETSRSVPIPVSGAYAVEPQHGGRAPAPGALAIVQAFLNTQYDLTAERGGEVLVHADALVTWLATHGLMLRQSRLHPGDLERALAVREGLRASAFANTREPLDSAAVERLQRASAGSYTEVLVEL